jgi:hypothetical protein
MFCVQCTKECEHGPAGALRADVLLGHTFISSSTVDVYTFDSR